MYRFDLAYTNIVFNARDCEVRVDYLYMAWVSAKRARRRFAEHMVLGARARSSHALAQAARGRGQIRSCARRTGTDSQQLRVHLCIGKHAAAKLEVAYTKARFEKIFAAKTHLTRRAQVHRPCRHGDAGGTERKGSGELDGFDRWMLTAITRRMPGRRSERVGGSCTT